MSSHQATSESQDRPRKMRRGADGIRKNREILGTLGLVQKQQVFIVVRNSKIVGTLILLHSTNMTICETATHTSYILLLLAVLPMKLMKFLNSKLITLL